MPSTAVRGEGRGGEGERGVGAKGFRWVFVANSGLGAREHAGQMTPEMSEPAVTNRDRRPLMV